MGLAGKITGIHEAFFRELTEAEKAFDEATIRLEDASGQFLQLSVNLGTEKTAGNVLLYKVSKIKKVLVNL